jgi:spore coat protein U-like protein
MNVSITVTSACNISVTDINFGAVPASALASALTSTAGMGGLFTYTCGASTATPSLTASQGQNYSGSNRMKGTLGAFLPYSLNIPAVAAFSGAAQTAQITATIPAQGTLPAADTYTDAVVLTLSY